MAAEGKAPTLAEEYSLPPKEVPVENSAEEKFAISTMAEVVHQKDTESPAADETTAAVEEKSETAEVEESSEKPEAEETNLDAEETSDEKPEIKIETAPEIFVSPQQIKQDIASYARLNIIGA